MMKNNLMNRRIWRRSADQEDSVVDHQENKAPRSKASPPGTYPGTEGFSNPVVPFSYIDPRRAPSYRKTNRQPLRRLIDLIDLIHERKVNLKLLRRDSCLRPRGPSV